MVLLLTVSNGNNKMIFVLVFVVLATVALTVILILILIIGIVIGILVAYLIKCRLLKITIILCSSFIHIFYDYNYSQKLHIYSGSRSCIPIWTQ